MTTLTALLFFSICFAAYFVRGVSGFGSALVATPLLAHFIPLQTVVPLILILDFSANIVMTRATKGEADWKELKPVLAMGLLGVPIGALLLTQAPKAPLLLLLGALILIFGLRNALGIHNARPVHPAWAWPAGLAGGAISGLFGTGGPPYVIYLSRRIGGKSALRASIARLFLVEGGVRLVVFALLGLLALGDYWYLLFPGWLAVFSGLRLGGHVHLRMTHAQILRAIGGLLVLSGVSLLAKGGLMLAG